MTSGEIAQKERRKGTDGDDCLSKATWFAENPGNTPARNTNSIHTTSTRSIGTTTAVPVPTKVERAALQSPATVPIGESNPDLDVRGHGSKPYGIATPFRRHPTINPVSHLQPTRSPTYRSATTRTSGPSPPESRPRRSGTQTEGPATGLGLPRRSPRSGQGRARCPPAIAQRRTPFPGR